MHVSGTVENQMHVRGKDRTTFLCGILEEETAHIPYLLIFT